MINKYGFEAILLKKNSGGYAHFPYKMYEAPYKMSIPTRIFFNKIASKSYLLIDRNFWSTNFI
jgi:hypothetical protein